MNPISILGQSTASDLLSAQIRATVEAGKFAAPILISGPAGVGKTHASRLFVGAMQEATGADVISVPSASDFAHSQSPAAQSLVEALKTSALGGKAIIVIDEAHLLPLSGSKNPSPMERLFRSLFLGAGEGWARNGSLEFSGEKIVYDTAHILPVLMTNFPERVCKGNAEAFMRRILSVPLARYSHDVMPQIIKSYFAEKGFRVSADVQKRIPRFHRGTLEALDDLLKKAQGYEQPISPEAFRSILPTCKFTLRGFTHEEVACLKWLADTTEPTRRSNVAIKFPSVDLGALYRHAQEQRVKLKGKEEETNAPFLVFAGSRLVVTEAGKEFLKSLSRL